MKHRYVIAVLIVLGFTLMLLAGVFARENPSHPYPVGEPVDYGDGRLGITFADPTEHNHRMRRIAVTLAIIGVSCVVIGVTWVNPCQGNSVNLQGNSSLI